MSIQLLAQPLNMRIHGAGIAVIIGAPEQVQQSVAGEDPSRRGGKRPQQLDFLLVRATSVPDILAVKLSRSTVKSPARRIWEDPFGTPVRSIRRSTARTRAITSLGEKGLTI